MKTTIRFEKPVTLKAGDKITIETKADGEIDVKINDRDAWFVAAYGTREAVAPPAEPKGPTKLRVIANDKPSGSDSDQTYHLVEDGTETRLYPANRLYPATLCGLRWRQWLTKPQDEVAGGRLCARCERAAKSAGYVIPYFAEPKGNDR